jgi:hypothetical protein
MGQIPPLETHWHFSTQELQYSITPALSGPRRSVTPNQSIELSLRVSTPAGSWASLRVTQVKISHSRRALRTDRPELPSLNSCNSLNSFSSHVDR